MAQGGCCRGCEEPWSSEQEPHPAPTAPSHPLPHARHGRGAQPRPGSTVTAGPGAKRLGPVALLGFKVQQEGLHVPTPANKPLSDPPQEEPGSKQLCLPQRWWCWGISTTGKLETCREMSRGRK